MPALLKVYPDSAGRLGRELTEGEKRQLGLMPSLSCPTPFAHLDRKAANRTTTSSSQRSLVSTSLAWMLWIALAAAEAGPSRDLPKRLPSFERRIFGPRTAGVYPVYDFPKDIVYNYSLLYYDAVDADLRPDDRKATQTSMTARLGGGSFPDPVGSSNLCKDQLVFSQF